MDDLIYVLDPNTDDTRLLTLKLENRGFQLKIFKTSVELIRTLHEETMEIKIILTEYRLSEEKNKTGLDIIQHINSQSPDPPPIIMLSAEGDEQIAVEAIKLGAMDYVPKSRGWYNHIHLRIIHSIVHKNMMKELKELRSQTDAVFENSFDSILVVDHSGQILQCNQKLCDLLEHSRDGLIGKIQFANLFDDPKYAQQILEEVSQGHVITDQRVLVKSKFGFEISTSFSATLMHEVNKLMFIFTDLRVKEELLNQLNELKRIASEKFILSAFKVGEFGPEVLCVDKKTPYLNDELLMKMSIFFSVSLGQGDNIHKGLYGPLPMPVLEEGSDITKFDEQYVSIVYSLSLKDVQNKD